MYQCWHETFTVSNDFRDPFPGSRWCLVCGKTETAERSKNWPLPANKPYTCEDWQLGSNFRDPQKKTERSAQAGAASLQADKR
jgi:hypothetical protein